MFLFTPKMNFIIHFFLEILYSKEHCNLVGHQHFSPYLRNQNFARYGTADKISIKTLFFIFDYFQEQLMKRFFKKSKKPFLGAILDSFAQIWWKINFRGRSLCQFLKIAINYDGAKNQKTLTTFLEKNNETMDR